MPHLNTERIAAFDHASPTADELAHLSTCVICRAERDAYATLARLAAQDGYAMASSQAPRLSDWESLSVVLRAEGMLTSASDHGVPETPLIVRALDGSTERIERTVKVGRSALTPSIGRPTAGMPMWMRSVAALALLAGGMVGGRMSANTTLNPFAAVASATSSGIASSTTFRSTSLGGADTFASVEQATAVLSKAQSEYERASLWLAANDTTVHASDVYRARLAALDQMMAASRAALREAPQDPVLNNYYLAASTARETALQQLSSALPVDKTIEGY